MESQRNTFPMFLLSFSIEIMRVVKRTSLIGTTVMRLSISQAFVELGMLLVLVGVLGLREIPERGRGGSAYAYFKNQTTSLKTLAFEWDAKVDNFGIFYYE